MKIPIVEQLPADLVIPKGPRLGERRYYKMALLNTLIRLRPRVCLEIGTWKGGSAKIFRQYFAKYMPSGFLVTADIKKYEDVSARNVAQAQVYPHTVSIRELHKKIADSDLLPQWRMAAHVSIPKNVTILRKALPAGIKNYDFAFVDGDHWNIVKDFEIVKKLVAHTGYALLDDTTAYVWPCSMDYEEKIKPYCRTYDFEDWSKFPGTSLVWGW